MDTTGWKDGRSPDSICGLISKEPNQDGVRRGIQKPGVISQPTVNSPRTSLMFQSWRCGGFLQTWNFAAASVGDPEEFRNKQEQPIYGKKPGRLNMEPTNHPFRKEKPIFHQTSMRKCSMLIFRGVLLVALLATWCRKIEHQNWQLFFKSLMMRNAGSPSAWFRSENRKCLQGVTGRTKTRCLR